MAEKKKTDDKKKTVNIKASTGAWWKSTASEEKKTQTPAQDAVVDAEPKKQEDAPAKKKPAQKRGTRKPRAKKTDTPVKAEVKGVDATSPVESTTVDSSAEEIAVPPQRPSRSPRSTSRGRRKSPAAKKEAASKSSAKTKEENAAEVEAAPAELAAVETPVAQTAVASSEENVTPEAVADAEEKEKKPKRKPRPRRGRKGKSAQKTAAAESQAETVEDVAAADGDSPESPEEDAATTGQQVDDSDEQAETKDSAKKVCKLLINAEEPEECRLALLEDGRLESIHVSTVARTQTKNNIYKARIVAIEPSLQAAFVDYGTEKNGFLPFSEIHPEYYKQDLSDDIKRLVDSHQWKKLSITDVIEKGQEVLAQVVKEEVGKKGANMTTYLSIPGRCVVLMPGSDSSGISRKISGEEKRSELRDVMKAIVMPEGIGWIVRTASVDITKEALERDVENLLTVWSDIKLRGQEMDGVGQVYEDQQSIQRFLREHFDPDIEEILVDDKEALEQVRAFISTLPSGQRNVKVRLHQGARPIFNHFSVEDQIESIYQPRVNLPSGGSIVIDPTEALVAIDVNSGSTSKGKNFEASIFQANMEAAAELARQLRLRDLGGLIVVDFIDMRNKKHIQSVERMVRQSMKRDKAKVDFSRISKFGLMQISRQKLGAPIEAGNYRRCEHCQGRGIVRSVETLSLYYLRRIQTGASRKHVGKIECHFPLDVASYLLNYKRSELGDMEDKYHVEILIIGEPDMRPMDNDLIFHKAEKEPAGKKQA